MFNFNNLSLAARKAAALKGTHGGTWESVSHVGGADHQDVVIRIHTGNKVTELTRFDVDYAGQLTWNDVKR